MIFSSALGVARPACFTVSFYAGFGGFVMNKISKRFMAFASFALPFASFAEGESAQTGAQTALAQLTSLQGDVTTYITGASPVVATILGSMLGITLLFVGWRLIKRASNKA